MKKVLLFTLLSVVFVLQVMAQDATGVRVVDHFESGVPYRLDTHGNAVGFVVWGDQEGNVSLAASQVMSYSPVVLPDQTGANTVLAVSYDITGWGGFTHAFTNTVDWIGQDWSEYGAIRFWLYGNNTGQAIQIDLFDNGAPGETYDTYERYYARIQDDYTGWQMFTIPFSDFQRRTDFQPGGAPNDGLTLTEIYGYAFIFPAGAGAQVAYLDDVMLVTDDYLAQEIILAQATEAPSVVSEPIVHNWELVWSDEFDAEAGASPNPENWTCEVGGQGWGNQEWEYYTPRAENVSHDGDGNLLITAREETPDNSRCWYGECLYTSARCITEGKMEFTYGRVEARIQVPFGQGIWPAFWMLGANFRQVGWPNSGEIDILENIGKEPNILHGTVHGPGYSGGNGIGDAITLEEPLADDFHVYAIEWEPEEIRWYIDDVLYHTLTTEDVGSREWVFDHDFFLLINLAVGGLWPGYPDETTTFPQVMTIDYIRVYQDEG